MLSCLSGKKTLSLTGDHSGSRLCVCMTLSLPTDSSTPSLTYGPFASPCMKTVREDDDDDDDDDYFSTGRHNEARGRSEKNRRVVRKTPVTKRVCKVFFVRHPPCTGVCVTPGKTTGSEKRN